MSRLGHNVNRRRPSACDLQRLANEEVHVSLALLSLPTIVDQAERLIELGLDKAGGVGADELRAWAASAPPPAAGENALLVIHPDRLPPSMLAPFMTRQGRSGFLVTDMQDVDKFSDIDALTVPPSAAYLVHEPERGDDLANWSPDEALPAMTTAGRTPLTLTEGIHWVLQQPEALERNHCFMTIGSRLRKANGALDARTPAIWISNGTGRDGAERRHAAKVGWCWAGNRHTWLGFASTTGRSAFP
jgi:hypothetical protein